MIHEDDPKLSQDIGQIHKKIQKKILAQSDQKNDDRLFLIIV